MTYRPFLHQLQVGFTTVAVVGKTNSFNDRIIALFQSAHRSANPCRDHYFVQNQRRFLNLTNDIAGFDLAAVFNSRSKMPFLLPVQAGKITSPQNIISLRPV